MAIHDVERRCKGRSAANRAAFTHRGSASTRLSPMHIIRSWLTSSLAQRME
jgi:hypothetical protein